MQCPKCSEGILEKIQFRKGKHAFLCNTCGTFWYINEHIDMTTGHMMDEEGKNTFAFVNETDEEQESVQEEREREVYEFYERR